MWWKKRSLYLLTLSLIIASVVWLQMGMFLSHIIFGIDINLNFFKFCLSLLTHGSLYYTLSIFLISTVIAATLLVTAINIGKQIFGFHRFKEQLMLLKDSRLSEQYNRKFEGHKKILVVRSGQSFAFTMGLKSPAIVLSTALIDLLAEEELKAVIEHERSHQNNHDPLILFVLHIIAQSMWFIPLTNWCYLNYKIISEIVADEYAIRKTGSEIGLSSALLKLVKHHFTTKTSPIVVQFTDESVNYRLQQLVEPKQAIPVKIKPASVFISCNVLIVFLGMVLITLA